MNVVARDSRVLLTTLNWDNFYQHYQWSNSPVLQQEEMATTFPREPVYVFKQRFEAMMQPDRDARDFEIHTVAGALIGVAYIDWQADSARPCIGLTLCDTTCRGQGLGRASLQLLLKVCFSHHSFDHVSAVAHPFQRAWLRLLRQTGFKASTPEASPTSFLLSRETHARHPLPSRMTAKAA